jgi:hypothetical protein
VLMSISPHKKNTFHKIIKFIKIISKQKNIYWGHIDNRVVVWRVRIFFLYL